MFGKRALALGVVLIATLAMGVQTAAPTSTRISGTPLVWSQTGSYVASHYCMNMQCSVQYWLKNGTAFHMVCWGDTVNQKGNYYSPRWFYGYFTNATYGWKYYTYVHSSYVYYQWSVPHC